MNSEFPLVTIVTPTYNQVDFLEETMKSVLGQDYPKIEYIVVNDGSTDGTADIMDRFSDSITAIHQDNAGQAVSLNKGWNLASGEYLAYLSSDDLLDPRAISVLVGKLRDNPAAVCAFPDCDLIDEESKVVKRGVARDFDLVDLVVKQECYIGPGAIFRKSAFDIVGGWKSDLRLAPDREFWMRLASHGTFVFVEECLAGYRLHSGSISYRDVDEETSREYVRVLDDYFTGEGLRPEIAELKDEAYANAFLILARNSFRSGDFRRGRELYKEAKNYWPQIDSWSTRMRLVRNVISKPIRIAIAKARSLLRP